MLTNFRCSVLLDHQGRSTQYSDKRKARADPPTPENCDPEDNDVRASWNERKGRKSGGGARRTEEERVDQEKEEDGEDGYRRLQGVIGEEEGRAGVEYSCAREKTAGWK